MNSNFYPKADVFESWPARIALGFVAFIVVLVFWFGLSFWGLNNESVRMESTIIAQVKACATIRDTGWQRVQGTVQLSDRAMTQLKDLYGAVFSAANAQQSAASITAFGALIQGTVGGTQANATVIEAQRVLNSVLQDFSSCQNNIISTQNEYAKLIGVPSGSMVGRVQGAWPASMFAAQLGLPRIISGPDTKFFPNADGGVTTVFSYQPLVTAGTASEFGTGTLRDNIVPTLQP